MAIISPEGQKPPVVVAWMPELDATIYGNAGAPKVGTRLTAMGKVWDWQGMLLIRVRELNQIRIESHSHTYLRGVTAAAVAPAVAAKPVVEQAGFYGPENVPELPKLIGKEIAFCGTVTAFRKSWSDKAPNIATLGEVPNALEMVYWTNNGQTEPAGASTIGSTVCVTGLLQDYRGKMQLRVNDLGKMSVRQAPATVTAPASAAAAVAPLPSAPAPAPSSAEPMAAPFAAAP